MIDASKYYISLNDTDIPDKIEDFVRNEMTASDGNMYGISHRHVHERMYPV